MPSTARQLPNVPFRLLPPLLLALAPAPALANAAPLALTGPLAAAAQQSMSTPGIDADEAAAIVAAILADSSTNPTAPVDPTEKALIDALVKEGAPTVAVTINGRRATIGPLQPEAGRLLAMIFVGVNDPAPFLRSGNPEFLQHMARIYSLPNQTLVNQMRRTMAQDLMAAWRDSTFGNSYEPLRKRIGTAVNAYEVSSPATRKAGRRLLYSAMGDVDRQANNSVPDFLYNWLKD